MRATNEQNQDEQQRNTDPVIKKNTKIFVDPHVLDGKPRPGAHACAPHLTYVPAQDLC